MTAEPIPFRSLRLVEPPDLLIKLLDAADGVPDATVIRLLDDYRPTTPLRLLKPCPEHDASCEPFCEARWGYPSEPLIRRAVDIARTRPRPELGGKLEGM